MQYMPSLYFCGGLCIQTILLLVIDTIEKSFNAYYINLMRYIRPCKIQPTPMCG